MIRYQIPRYKITDVAQSIDWLEKKVSCLADLYEWSDSSRTIIGTLAKYAIKNSCVNHTVIYLGYPVNSIMSRLNRANLPSSKIILQHFRLNLICYLIERSDGIPTISSIADDLEYSSARYLHRHIKNVFRITAREFFNTYNSAENFWVNNVQPVIEPKHRGWRDLKFPIKMGYKRIPERCPYCGSAA